MAFIKVGKTRNVNLKVLLAFAIVSALIFTIVASGEVGLGIPSAYAHASLIDGDRTLITLQDEHWAYGQGQNAAVGATMIIVYYSEAIEIDFSELQVFDSNGNRIDNMDTSYYDGNFSLIITTPPLEEGIYTVTSKVLSKVDGHTVSDKMIFAAGDAEVPQSSNWDQEKELQLLHVIGGPDSELFSNPTDIAIGESGNIYVADYTNKRIQILNSIGELVQTIELKGSPHGITLDKDENIYVTEWWDFIGVEKFTKTGEPATDFEIKDQSVFGLPADVVLDSNGILYVLEHRNLDIDYGEDAGVHKIDVDGSYLEFIPIPNDSINDKSKFTLMTIDNEDYLYIVDQTGNDIIILDSINGDGRALALIYFANPTSIAINPDGYFFIGDDRSSSQKKSIHIFDSNHQSIRSIGEYGIQDGKISGTHGIEFDKDGNMYVIDSS